MNPFHWFIANKLQNYLFRFKMRQTRLYIYAYEDYVYPTSSFSYHQKSYLPKQIHLLLNQYGDEQNKFSSNNVRTI